MKNYNTNPKNKRASLHTGRKTDIEHSQTDLETNQINLNEGPVQVIGVNRLTHIRGLARNISIAQNEAQLSSGENTANQINLFFSPPFCNHFSFFIFQLGRPFCNLIGPTLLELELF